ncbi:MAG: S8 family serine peptidase [Crocinitomicaceae bacterium]|nr:S8 family serine peptidase [Crocinitomicaceae bacterium]
MKKIYLLLIGFLILPACFFSLYGQDASLPLLLKSGTYNLEKNISEFVEDPNYTPSELYQETYYRIIQFSEVPGVTQKSVLKAAGIELLDYLPERAFYAAIQTDADLTVLNTTSAVSVVPVNWQYKLTPELLDKKYPEWALFPNDRIGLNTVYYETVAKEDALLKLRNLGAEITMETDVEILSFMIPIDKVQMLYEIPEFYYFEPFDKPGEPEGYEDVTNHRSNYINNPVGVGKSYDGSGVTVMMQDDGIIGPHIDYEGRITTETSSNFGDHGDHVAGIIMGAGNLDPDGVGNAKGAHLLVYSSSNTNFNLVPMLYENEELVITSKSYGNGNNAGYTSLARQLDEQCYEHDALVHVFSAGNSGTQDYGYGAGAGWGNITGGHKQGKNVLAVGNLSDTDVLSNSSSRGPADDGRLKPDICAVGSSVYSTIDPNTYEDKSGTSMACPGVAGSLALLYEAYRDMNGGQNPSAALINGAVLNTADDLGNPGPDFKFGWGRINVRRAYNLLNEGQYQNGEIQNGAANVHTITVPAGVKQVRIMVYWTDYKGSTTASKALVNDINMTVSAPGGSVHQPLILDPTPNAGILNSDAQPGVDDLNNVEQVVIDDPASGTYTINLNGFNIPQGPQKYYVVYEFVEEDVVLTFPIGGESLTPGQSELIRWDAIGETETFSLDYSIDGGLTWNNIVSSLPGDWRSFPWMVPANLVTGKARFRINRGTQSSESKEDVSIIRQPNNLNIEWACPNSFNLSWNPVPGAIAYEVSLLGDYYMDSAGYTTTTDATIYANSMVTQWVSVKAIGPDNAVGKRAIALEKSPGTFGCTLSPPEAAFTSVCNQTGPGSCVQFTDMSTNAGQGAAWEWSFPGGSPSTSNLEKPVVCYDTEGFYDVQLIVKNGVAEDTVVYTQYVEIRNGAELPFKEDFEESMIPVNWVVENDGNNTNWTIDANSSAYNIGKNSIMFNNFSNDSIGSTSRFITEQIDLSQEDVIYALSFDVAYAPGIGINDSLRVYVTNDCGNTYQLIYSAGGNELATADPSSSLFIPTSNQWRNEVASLAVAKGMTSVSFIFESYSENGNAVYVDNINVKLSEENFSEHELTVYPNPLTNELNIAGLVEGEIATIRIHSANGELVYENEFEVPGGVITLNTTQWADGMYIIKVNSPSKTHKEKLIKGDG